MQDSDISLILSARPYEALMQVQSGCQEIKKQGSQQGFSFLVHAAFPQSLL